MVENGKSVRISQSWISVKYTFSNFNYQEHFLPTQRKCIATQRVGKYHASYCKKKGFNFNVVYNTHFEAITSIHGNMCDVILIVKF